MKITADLNDKGKRLDSFTVEAFFDIYYSIKGEELTRSKVQKMIDTELVKVNGKKQKASYKVNIEDVIELNEIEKEKILPKNIPLNILYEDDFLIVLNKQKGLICHPSAYNKEDTLVNALLYHTDKLSDTEGEIRRGIVHRLDCNTSGLMLVAKTNEAHIKLKKDIQTKKTVRKYLGVCYGNIENDFGTIDKPLVHYLSDTVKMNVSDNGLNSVTEYRVLERYKEATFLELKLQTGRTHQIRCHLASIGHPLVNDDLYGAKGYKRGKLGNLKTEGQVLMSYYLSFTHPISNDTMEFEIKEDEFHPDLKKTLKLLRSLK